jgi:hypothetical protein
MKHLNHANFLTYQSISVLFLITLVSVSCSVQKRRYMNGCHVEWHHKNVPQSTQNNHAKVQYALPDKIKIEKSENDTVERNEHSILLSPQHSPETRKQGKNPIGKISRTLRPVSLQWTTDLMSPTIPKEAKNGVIRPRTLWWFALSGVLGLVGMAFTVYTIYFGIFATILALSVSVFVFGWIFLLFNREARWQSLFATVGWLMVANAMGVLLIYPGLFFLPYLIMGFALVIGAGKPYGKAYNPQENN